MPVQHLAETANFGQLLKEFQPHKLIEKEIRKTDYFLSNAKKHKWTDGQPLKLAHRLAERSSMKIGGLVESGKITQAKFKSPTITDHKFASFALKFLERDLKKHKDLRTSFIKLLPDEVRMASRRMQYLFNLMIWDKGRIVDFTGDGAVDGKIKVAKPQRLEIGERMLVVFDDGATADREVYVGSINMNTREVTLVEQDGVTAVDMTGFTEAAEQTGRGGLYIVGYDSDNAFTSFIDLVFDASSGGSDTLYEGQVNKSEAPIYQSILTDASSWNNTNLVNNLIDFYYDTEELGQNKKREVVGSYSFFRAVVKALEGQKRYTGNFVKSPIGSSVIEIIGSGAPLRVVAVEQLPVNYAMILPWDDFCLAHDDLFKPHVDLNGDMYKTERVAGTSADGYEYIHDMYISGEIYAKRLSATAGIHGLNLS